jgi:hypothetical protein
VTGGILAIIGIVFVVFGFWIRRRRQRRQLDLEKADQGMAVVFRANPEEVEVVSGKITTKINVWRR